MTAALGAGGANGLLGHNSSSNDKSHDKSHFIESALAGMATNRLANGKSSRRRTQSEDHGGGGFKGLASAGALAAAGKEAYDHYKQHKARGRQNASDDDDGDDGGSSDGRQGDGRRRQGPSSKKRSHSLSGYLSKGLSAMGLADNDDNTKGRRRQGRRPERYRSPSPSDADGHSDDDSRLSGNRPSGRRPRRSHRQAAN